METEHYSKTSQHFMEPECSLAHSQELFTCIYPEPDQSSQYTPFYLTKLHLNIIHSLRLGLHSGLFPSGFLTNNLYAFLFFPNRATCLAHLCLIDIIILIIPG
jgi:hypothetical protein